MDKMRLYRHGVVKTGKKIESAKWYTDIRFNGKRFRLPLFESKKLSGDFVVQLNILLGQYESGNGYDRDVQRWLGQISHDMLARFVKMGLVDGARVAAGARLEGHLDDYKAYLEHKGDTPAYAGKSVSRINGILAGCKFRTLNDIQCSKIQKFLADEIQAGRIGQKTANHYTRAIKTFFNWMVQDGRIDTNPVQHLRMLTVTLIKKDRRALTTDEIASLLGWLAEHGTTAYGLTAAQRRIVYLLGLTTGLRASEIASLTSSSIDFQGKTVTVKAAYTKNRQAAILPLRSDILALLQDYTAGMMPGVALFDIPHRTADMIRADLDGARLHWIGAGDTAEEKQRREKQEFLKATTADGEIDFHALRHCFGSMLATANIHPKTAQTLMRHSTITLTMDRYSHTFRGADADAVDALPSFEQKKAETKKA